MVGPWSKTKVDIFFCGTPWAKTIKTHLQSQRKTSKQTTCWCWHFHGEKPLAAEIYFQIQLENPPSHEPREKKLVTFGLLVFWGNPNIGLCNMILLPISKGAKKKLEIAKTKTDVLLTWKTGPKNPLNSPRFPSISPGSSSDEFFEVGSKMYSFGCIQFTPLKINMELEITQLKRKIIFQTSVLVFHVDLPGCILFQQKTWSKKETASTRCFFGDWLCCKKSVGAQRLHFIV